MSYMFCVCVFALVGVGHLAIGEGNRREHKVHNIVLYPERHSWCQTTPIKQIVAMPGFEPITIDNNVCVGACYSYSIPRTQPAEPGELIGPYCDSCQPKETKCYHVTLKSSGKSMQKRVQIITNCSCSSCGKQLDTTDCDLTDANTSELPTNLLSLLTHQELKVDPHEVPELLTIGSSPIANTSSSTSASSEFVGTMGNQIPASPTYDINEDIVNILNDIQKTDDVDTGDEDKDEAGVEVEDEQEQEDEEQQKLSRNIKMQQLLELVQGPDGKLTDKDVMEFVNYVNEHLDLELDSLKLKRALEHFEEVMHREELRMRHRNFGLGHLNQHIHHSDEDVPVITGIEGSHVGLGHKKGSHIGMGIKTHTKVITENTLPSLDDDDVNNVNDGVNFKVEPETSTPTPQTPPPLPHTHHHGHLSHHKLGDEQHVLGGVGHLVMGPHGSLVVAPGEAKLNLASDEVAPNHEGVVIDYQHHDGNSHHVHHKHASHSHHHGGHHGNHGDGDTGHVVVDHGKHDTVEEIVSQQRKK